MKNWIKLVISLIIPFLASLIGGLFTTSDSEWYLSLIKPKFNPPGWVFGPVWTVLYILMGISLYLVWSTKNKNKRIAFLIFGIQLFLNAFWSIAFFGLHNVLLSFIVIIFLLAAIIATMIYFYRINRFSAYLLLPYLLWVSFASILNFAILYLNFL